MEGRRVLQVLLQELFLVINSKQFELLPSFPSRSSLQNKSLNSLRKKLLGEIFANVESWMGEGVSKEYKRKKNYACDYCLFRVEERDPDTHSQAVAQALIKIRT